MILFGLITVLEDTGYMARISFLTDKLMRKVGLNGKSVMPMISGFACAVPAIMSSRNIENKKERLLTILVTPLMSCSARLPVYTMLIALVVPNKKVWDFQQPGPCHDGSLPSLAALVVSGVAKKFLSQPKKPSWSCPFTRAALENVAITMVSKARISCVTRESNHRISMILWG
jgi:ferrous iron transport protein B